MATSSVTIKSKISKYFAAHGRFCATHPWEVIVSVVTLTVCALSMSLLSGGKVATACGFSKPCEPADERSETVTSMLSIVNCLAVIYLYNQLRNLRGTGSKYLLGIAGLFTIFSSFVFGSAVINIIDSKVSGLDEALPFFLLLIDLSKASSLAKIAFKSRNKEEARESISSGIACLGPIMTLDTLVEVLLISIGTISGVPRLETMCYFGCISVLASYVVFMTFFPASLALVLEVCPCDTTDSDLDFSNLARGLLEEETKKPNPVIERVKIIMALGLVVVHFHSRFFSNMTGLTFGFDKTGSVEDGNADEDIEMVPLPRYLLWTVFNLTIDQFIVIILSSVLFIKYIFFDMPETNIPTPVHSHNHNPPPPPAITGSCTLSKSLAAQSIVSLSTRSPTISPPDANSMEMTSDVANIEDCVFTLSEPEPERKDSGIYSSRSPSFSEPPTPSSPPRPLDICVALLKSDGGANLLTDKEVIMLVEAKHIPAYKLESVLGDYERGVSIRRQLLHDQLMDSVDDLTDLPFTSYPHYSIVNGACCENVIGYMPIPVGYAGPLILDGMSFYVPMSTTEGALVASTNRGCRALALAGGAHSSVINDGMTRGPVVRLQSATAASKVKLWLEDLDNYRLIEGEFNSTSRFARLKGIKMALAGRLLYIRFKASTGDAMGMNMLSKGVEKSLAFLKGKFPSLEVISLSGNFCTDKKSAAINWIEGRGKSVVCEATIPGQIVSKVLKTTIKSLVDLNISKNLIGSAMAGSIGGFNAHAANIVTAIFIATGQDPAQNVASSNCITLLEKGGANDDDLHISCTMPSIEIGTVGGGTVLPPQAACLAMLGVKGSNKEAPGENATKLARIVCGTVLAGELSLLSALAAGHLVKSHLTHNRSQVNLASIAEESNSNQK